MPKPSLQSYGLSEHDVVSFRRWENADSRGPVVCGIVGGACGYFGLANLGDGGLEFFGAWLGFIFGTGLCDWVGPKLRKWDSRLQRYDLFKAATKRFEAATEAFESAKKEREERELQRELRTRSEFWWSLAGHRFERELAILFQRQGYNVELTPGSNDGGIDIILKRSGRTTAVQCKRTQQPVGPAVAREFYGALIASGADDGILAATGGVTSGVSAFIAGKPIRVMDLSDILRLQRQSRPQE